ncbi:HD domain-containing protein [Paraburkholderia strydomiana]|uniref:phosphohydrolase n=1 Tax=Paraburkholderia strydomiana TaxID=1245417 RepID=UPI002865C7B6|nr:phosphohydrolase [Paraburkholderia strydomiana]MDR7008878.1 hypothetical protein [Paraburkholderia strydomiana]
MNVHIAGVPIPDSDIAQGALRFIQKDMPQMLVRHALRAFLFSSLIGRNRSLDFSLELLFVGAVFHHYGLAPRYNQSGRRFELDGADAAADFLSSNGVTKQEARSVRDAIALHTTFGLDGFESPLVDLLHAGVATDLIALYYDEIGENDRRAVLQAYPRERAFKFRIIEALADGMKQRPRTTFGNVNADVLDRCDPDFYRLNFCGLILGSQWDD